MNSLLLTLRFLSPFPTSSSPLSPVTFPTDYSCFNWLHLWSFNSTYCSISMSLCYVLEIVPNMPRCSGGSSLKFFFFQVLVCWTFHFPILKNSDLLYLSTFMLREREKIYAYFQGLLFQSIWSPKWEKQFRMPTFPGSVPKKLCHIWVLE